MEGRCDIVGGVGVDPLRVLSAGGTGRAESGGEAEVRGNVIAE